MKISKIKISKYHQFEDFELDLTYPEGHDEKEGQPLDKVCFIGQSGTGKTTLLELIKRATLAGSGHKLSNFEFEPRHPSASVYYQSKNGKQELHVEIFSDVGDFTNITKFCLSHNHDIKRLLYFPAGIANYNINNEALENGASKVEEPSTLDDSRIDSILYKIDKESLEKTWQEYSEKIKNHKNESINFRLKLIDNKTENINQELEKWKEKNPNPIEIIANECLDVFLNRFHLAVKTEIDDVREKDILPIKSLNNNTIVSYEKLSTGTKQIIYTAFPIYQLLKPDSIVLMDEPENSLYPDIQKEIIDYYTSFDKEKKSQFFFATHSPIIASSFEPWEIVELKFDSNGKVFRDKYYEGENHVGNYRLDPQILRYDQILTRIFDLSRNSDEKRSEKMQEYSILKNKVKHFTKDEIKNPTPENKDIIEKYLRLSDDLSGTWAISRHEKNQ